MRSSAAIATAVAAVLGAVSVPGRAAQAPVPVVTPTAGLVIERSVRLAPGTYRLPAPEQGAAITIRGQDLTVDLTGVTLEGGDPLADPDSYRGTGIGLADTSGVTLRGGAVRGYKVGVLARRSPRLRITGLDASYNWKQRLWSGIEKESLVDWMSFHDNEQDAWLRYGAAFYLSECDEAEVDHTRAVQGQNGLLITRSARVRVWNNTYAWMSALGLGLYRTTDSHILNNRLDWNVRGYSHGFYYRGQDSAAILMYEQSSRNVVAYNSATHGGDGLFLWAGNTTMDTGLGGANDNLFFGNDFSHAVANGIEATFSRNRFVQNRVDDCWHGVWGGYSYDSTFEGNTFSGNTDGIAIEHGQNITIRHNTFSSNDTAIRLWANVSQDPDWGYPRHRDTRSRDIAITGNSFADGKVGVALLRSLRVEVAGNRYRNLATVLQTGDGVEMLAFEPPVDPGRRPVAREAEPAGAPARPPGPAARLPEGARRGRDTIIVDEWGPYDYRSPKVWPVARPADRPLRLRVLGPGGAWTIRRLSGGTTTTRSGPVPGELTVALAGRGTDLDLELDYVGADVVTPRGVAIPAGTRVPVRYTWFDPAIDWATSFWVFDEASHPLTAPAAFADRLAQPPAHSAVLPRLDVLGSRAVGTGLPADRVALRAEATVTLPAGAYEIIVMSDDGVRVSVDGTRVIDRWSIHGTAIDRAPLAGGRRRIVVEYFEATGWAELQVRIVRRASDAGPAPREAHD